MVLSKVDFGKAIVAPGGTRGLTEGLTLLIQTNE